MRPLQHDDLVDLEVYEGLRADYRRAVISHKRERRIPVGESVTLLFEDRETLRFQVLEMLHVERITDPQKIQAELEVYNELIPGPRELSATLFVEITDPSRIRAELDRLIGIDEHVALELGEGPSASVVPARFDPKQLEEDRLSAVQYVRFALDESQAARFVDLQTPAWIRIDHPHYVARAPIAAQVRASLAAGLERDPRPLLDPQAERSQAPADRIHFETEGVRAWSPGRSRGAHVIVEARRADAALLAAESALWTELLDAVRRVASEIVATQGVCRIEAQLANDGEPARFHVMAANARSES